MEKGLSFFFLPKFTKRNRDDGAFENLFFMCLLKKTHYETSKTCLLSFFPRLLQLILKQKMEIKPWIHFSPLRIYEKPYHMKWPRWILHLLRAGSLQNFIEITHILYLRNLDSRSGLCWNCSRARGMVPNSGLLLGEGFVFHCKSKNKSSYYENNETYPIMDSVTWEVYPESERGEKIFDVDSKKELLNSVWIPFPLCGVCKMVVCALYLAGVIAG